MAQDTGHPSEFRWADPDRGEGDGQREMIIAIANNTAELIRIADALETLVNRSL